MDSHLWASTFLSQVPSPGAVGGQPLGVPTHSFRCSCPGVIPCCPCPHSALFLFQMGQEGEGTIWRVFLQFPFRDSCCEAKEAPGPWPNRLQLLHPALTRLQRVSAPWDRVLSHLPRHDSSANHLEPSFTRQGSVELIAHQNAELVHSGSEKEIA